MHSVAAPATTTRLTLVIAVLAIFASAAGIWTHQGPGPQQIESIRGEIVTTHGYGIYQQMSAVVAPQGIAQDVITLFLAVPLLLISLYYHRNGSVRGTFLLAGTTTYLLVTYLFYLTMAMYNPLFLVYAALLGCTFFSLFLLLQGLYHASLDELFTGRRPWRWSGWFLIINGSLIALLWLSVVLPPLLDGTLYPVELEHYTTLIVQGLDLGLLLPLSIVTGWLCLRKHEMGLLLAPVYLIFVSLIMIALFSKLIAMGLLGEPVFPAIVLIPILGAFAISLSGFWLSALRG